MDSDAPATKPRIGRPSTRVERTCGVCQTIFHAKPSKIAVGAARYCSVECRQQAQSLGVVGTSVQHTKPTVEVLCDGCGQTFKVYPFRDPDGARPARYCSRECWRLPPALKKVRRRSPWSRPK